MISRAFAIPADDKTRERLRAILAARVAANNPGVDSPRISTSDHPAQTHTQPASAAGSASEIRYLIRIRRVGTVRDAWLRELQPDGGFSLAGNPARAARISLENARAIVAADHPADVRCAIVADYLIR